MHEPPTLNQLNIIVADMSKTVDFYRRLGVAIDAEHDAHHIAVTLSNGLLVEFDTTAFVPKWHTGWKGRTGGGVVLGFTVPSRERVDALYDEMTTAGYRGAQPPYDAFWGARYAIVEDPDGNHAGLMSPIDRDRKFWPPSEPPTN